MPQKILLSKQRVPLWNVIDSADYDGDGQSDLLWRDVSRAGPGGVGVWHLSNPLYLSDIPLDLNLGTELVVMGSADYDADGSSDLLVYDPARRRLRLWLMDRDGVHHIENLGVLARGWLPVGFFADDAGSVP